MIVVDASAAVAGLLNAGQARQLLAEERTCAPEVIDVEVAHRLRRGVALGWLDDAAAGAALRAWCRLGIRRFTGRVLLERVWALRGELDANAACYIALAEALGCVLVTADSTLSAAGVKCPVMVVAN